MATYKSDEVTLKASAEKVFAKLSNLEGLKDLLQRVPENEIPADKKQMLDQIEITADSITIPGGPTGPIKLVMAQKTEPVLIRLEGAGTPVPLSMELRLTPGDATYCTGHVAIDLAIPAMLKPMVNGPLNKLTSEVGRMLSMLKFEGQE